MIEENSIMDTSALDANKLAKLLSSKSAIFEKGTEEYEDAREQIGYWRNTEEDAEENISPTLICIPSDEDDVRVVVKFATANGYKLAPRSGGHQICGLSSGGTNSKVIQVDLRKFNSVSVEKNSKGGNGRRVIAGAGVQLGVLSQILNDHKLHIPHGICPNVCVGGHYQSSAFGIWSRSLGLGLDYVTHIKICLASGEIITAHADDEGHYPLFWALRGGSPGAFGIVLEYQFNAVDVLSFPHAFLCKFFWENTEDTRERVFSAVAKMKQHHAYKKFRDLTIYAGCFPDLYNPYLASTPDRPRHTLTVLMGWTGVDNGSIHSPIPDDTVGSCQPGITFYDLIVRPLKEIPNRLDISIELAYEEDPSNNLSYLARLLFGSDVVGSLDKIRRERHGLLPPNEAEKNAYYTDLASELANEAGVDVDNENCRYTTITRFTKFDQFNEEFFLKTLADRMRILEETQEVWSMVQFFHQELQANESSAFPTRGNNYGYDIWVMWRPALGRDVGLSAMNWAHETDDALRAIMGDNTFVQTWCSTDECDMNISAHRRLYYPDDNHYRTLQAVKSKYDVQDIFTSKFTVKPFGDSLQVELPVQRGAFPNQKLLSEKDEQCHFSANQNYNILIGRMQSHAFGRPNDPYLTWINGDGNPQPPLTYGKLYEDVAAYASFLKVKYFVKKGDKLVLSYLPGPEFIKIFMACAYLGAIPVPIYPAIKDAKYQERFRHIIKSCNPKYIIVDRDVFVYRFTASLHRLFRAKGPKWIVAKRDVSIKTVEPEDLNRDDIALVQFTSGTTDLPKGAVLTHGNLMSQFKLIQDQLNFNEDGVGLMWVPPYHDLGLMGSLLSHLMGGNHLYMMSPLSLMKDPAIWFSSIAKFRATHTGAPNFAYSMCLDKLSDKQWASWDLSSLQMMMSAGEPIEQEAMDSLLEKLQSFCNVKKSIYCPSYGLAENAVCITTGGVSAVYLDPKELMCGNLEFLPKGLKIMSCGRVLLNVPVAIVDKDGAEIGEDKIGEIWISGPSLATHYVVDKGGGDLDKTIEGRCGRWFRTGDIGFTKNEELFVLSRAADTIRIGGNVVFPNIIESSVNNVVEGLRKGSTTVYLDTNSGHLTVAMEMGSGSKKDVMQILANHAQNHIANKFDLDFEAVHLLPPRSVLKTSSGKLQRIQTGSAISNGTIRPLASWYYSKEMVTMCHAKTVQKRSTEILTDEEW